MPSAAVVEGAYQVNPPPSYDLSCLRDLAGCWKKKTLQKKRSTSPIPMGFLHDQNVTIFLRFNS